MTWDWTEWSVEWNFISQEKLNDGYVNGHHILMSSKCLADTFLSVYLQSACFSLWSVWLILFSLRHLSLLLGNKFDHGAESIMPTLLNLVPNSAKVMATSGVAAIRLILRVSVYGECTCPIYLERIGYLILVIFKWKLCLNVSCLL